MSLCTLLVSFIGYNHKYVYIYELIVIKCVIKGFWHEQSRPDRDDYVIINLAPVPSQYHHNFNKYTTGVDLVNTPYDILSIMHYENTAFSSNGQYSGLLLNFS